MPSLQRVYAEALFKAAGESNAAKIYGEVLDLSNLFAESKELDDFLRNPVVPSHAKKEALRKIFPPDTGETTKNFIFLLVENKRIGILPEILKYLYRLLPENKNKLFMKIFTAGQLDEKIIGEIKDKYSKLYGGAEAEAEIIADPSLMGGVCVQIGDMRYDGALKTKLKNLKEKLI